MPGRVEPSVTVKLVVYGGIFLKILLSILYKKIIVRRRKQSSVSFIVNYESKTFIIYFLGVDKFLN
jgi:hypothetical protein